MGGYSTAQIGERLGMSERTVRMHISDMLEKTGFKNRLQLAVRARGDGLIINDGNVDLTDK
ncbi:MAG: helix-turn-helix transcriptional regulator [Ruminococcus sp.]|nr:helix-turn-helix transcriptional regulator [Ruminococcus sp.]